MVKETHDFGEGFSLYVGMDIQKNVTSLRLEKGVWESEEARRTTETLFELINLCLKNGCSLETVVDALERKSDPSSFIGGIASYLRKNCLEEEIKPERHWYESFNGCSYSVDGVLPVAYRLLLDRETGSYVEFVEGDRVVVDGSSEGFVDNFDPESEAGVMFRDLTVPVRFFDGRRSYIPVDRIRSVK